MNYRAEIDGLRAIAVLPVILFHAGFASFSGGFVGVDVFFVISGYLITGIILREVRSGTFSIIAFYERRARRILPALLVVSLACLPFAWLWMLPQEFKDFSESLIAVNLFSSNILFWQQSGYFDSAAELKPMLHTWSLAVEEQFYLFFPLLLLMLRRASVRAVALVLFTMVIASLLLAEWGSRNYPSAAFYLLPTRAWELGVGALLAASANLSSRVNGRVASVVSGGGLLLILCAVLFFDEAVRFPGLWALVPVLGTAAVIACATPQTATGRLLASPLLVGIGLLSYSAYLWHQPLFAFARLRLYDGVPPVVYLLLSVLSLLLAYLSWRYVERPFRNRARVSPRQVYALCGATAAFVFAFGALGTVGYGLPQRMPDDVAALVRGTKPDRDERRCEFNGTNAFSEEKVCVYGESRRSIAVWGDSHARVAVMGLQSVLDQQDFSLYQYTSTGCTPVVGYDWAQNHFGCSRHVPAMLQSLLHNPSLNVVVVAARWPLFFEHRGYDNGEGGKEWSERNYPVVKRTPRMVPHSAAYEHAIAGLLQSTIDSLLQAGKRVVLVYSIPEAGWDVPKYLARERFYGVLRQEPLSTSYEHFQKRVHRAHEALDSLPDHPNLVRVHPEQLFCDTYLQDRCVVELNGRPLYYDDDHLAGIGAELLAERIASAVSARGWLPMSLASLRYSDHPAHAVPLAGDMHLPTLFQAGATAGRSSRVKPNSSSF